jgi:Tfp pilus assembly protein PilX
MNYSKTRNPKSMHPRRSRGFALIVTLSLMILLTVIAVGLLSLSSISLRASSQSSDMNVARGNARMALILAIGELQKTAGIDTRVTARADLVAANTAPNANGAPPARNGSPPARNGSPPRFPPK